MARRPEEGKGPEAGALPADGAVTGPEAGRPELQASSASRIILGHAGGCTAVEVETAGEEVVRGTVLRTACTIMKGILWVEE